MRRLARHVVAIAALLVLMPPLQVCAEEGAAPLGWEEVAARKKADVAAQLLARTLLTELETALQKGGPAAGVRICKEVAQKVTQDVGAREGVTVRRTALRVRNPDNRPDDFERAWLERAQQELAAGREVLPAYEVERRSDGARQLRHLRPIVFPGGICSQCHGRSDEISQEVRDLLRVQYPDDRATGFAPGDLRGAISVKVPLRENP
jgi:hypothetical protein